MFMDIETAIAVGMLVLVIAVLVELVAQCRK